MPTSTEHGIVKPSSDLEPADLYGVATRLADSVDDWIDAGWTAYTPGWGGTVSPPAIGNGTLTGAYIQRGNTVHFRIFLSWGSTTTAGSGAYSWTLPTAFAGNPETPVGGGTTLDLSASARTVGIAINAATSTQVWLMYGSTFVGASAAPYTWATGDVISLAGTYEIA